MNKLIQFYFRHKKLCLLLVVAVMALTAVHSPEVAHAQDLDPETTSLLNDINAGMIFVIKGASMLMWPVLLMIGSLLDNDLVFGGAMGEKLLDVWVQVRNLVNIVFVIILLFIAVFNVLGRGEELGGFSLGFKAVIPKFILALVAVNFSFLAVKVMLDFTNVMTGAVFAIPATVGSTFELKEQVRVTICGTPSNEVPLKPMLCKGTELSDKALNFMNKLDRSNIAVAYAIRFGKATDLKFIRDGLQGVTQLAFNILFNAVLFVVYAVSFIALFIVLLGRLVVLWIVVALSPLMAVSAVLPNLKEVAGGGDEVSKKFVKSATAPLAVGFVLSLGYVMLDAFAVDKGIHGALLSSNSLDALDPNSIPTSILDLQQLMIAIGSVAIVWMGVFAATQDTVGSSVIDGIKEYTGSFGKFMLKLPAYAQVIPTKRGTKGGASLAQIINAPRDKLADIISKGAHFPGATGSKEMRLDAIDHAARSGAVEFGKHFARDLGTFGTPEGIARFKKAMEEHDDALAGALKQKPANAQGIAEAIFQSNTPYSAQLKEALKSEGITNPTDLAQKLKTEADRYAQDEGNKPEPPAKFDPKAALDDSQQDPAELAKRSEFKDTGWTPAEVAEFKKLPMNVRSALLEVDEATNQVKHTVNEQQIKAAATLETAITGLNQSQTQTGVNAIDVARRTGLTNAQLKKLVESSQSTIKTQLAAQIPNT